MFFFFFSSRRRHTRLQGDWSSDVCSSDLGSHAAGGRAGGEGLVIAALGLLAALQGAPPDVTARVDRARLTAGEELRLTVRARSRTAEPVTVVLPALTGFAITRSPRGTEGTIG